MDEQETLTPQDLFEEFFKSESYRRQFAALGLTAKTSVYINFEDLIAFNHDLAENLINKPLEFLEYAKHAALAQLRIEDSEYAEQVKGLNVRVYNLFDTISLSNVGANNISKLIMIRGTVVKATSAKPKALKAAFECKRCGTINYVEQTTPFLRPPFQCENPSCFRKGHFTLVKEESEFIDTQELWIQEKPEDLPAGQLPTSLQTKIMGEMINTARPGDDVAVVGIVEVTPRVARSGKLNTFNLFLNANSIKTIGKQPEAIATPEDIREIKELSADPWVHRKIISSIAPSIYGYENVKEAIIYLLFGGIPKERPDIKIRGDINILLIGDPGTAKTQLLRYVTKIAPRGLYTSGRGTTGVGLTAAVLRNKSTGEYSLEAGALVLADKGVACIDELDKMREEDRSAIHETLEQHTVSIAKGGIVATLNARTAVLAAANPILGRYNDYKTVVENINLPPTLLSRFDLIFLMLDKPDVEKDKALCQHILNIHRENINQPPISPDLLRKYIAYAKQITPTLTTEASQKIREFYLKMRKISTESIGSPIAIGPRQLEALIRLSEARTRATLRNEVLPEDAEAAINIMMRSLQEVGIDMTSGKIDIDLIMTGKPKSLRDKASALLSIIADLQKQTDMVERSVVISEAEEKYKIMDANRILGNLLRDGAIFCPREGYLKKT